MTEKLIEWREVLGNPYRQPLHPDMLTPEGHKVCKLGRMQGMGKSEPPIPLVITYRFDYVVAFLSTTVFCRLQVCPQDQMIKTLSEAYQEWNNKNDSRATIS